MENPNTNNDYLLVFSELERILNESKSDSGTSFAPKRSSSHEYSLSESAIQFGTKNNALIIFDIEINQFISDEIIGKWVSHSSICSNYYLLIPKDMVKDVESICASLITNYEVKPYHFEKKGTDRIVIIDF